MLAVLSGYATSPAPANNPQASQPPACTGAEFRQFDFWVGNWKVMNPHGKQVGTNEITRASEGCAIREQWKSAAGGSGMSINYYDPGDRKWHQDWVGGDGLILHLQGGLSENAMILSGPSKIGKETALNRVIWTPMPDGKVKQEWTVSKDDGGTWKTVFVGIYEKQ